MTNTKGNDQFSGEWILLYDDKIIDHSANVEEILTIAEEKFPKNNFPYDKVKITKIFHGSPREKLLDK